MTTKAIFKALLKRIKHGAVRITYWSGETEAYGHGKPLCHVTFKSAKAARAVLRNMSVGFGEGYMNSLIEVDDFDGFAKLFADNAHVFDKLEFTNITRLRERNTKRRQKRQIQSHYDLGNDFYKLWLDPSMTYTCAYFKSAKDSLETAQKQKLEHVLRKLQLKKGQYVLDIGSGWGSLLITAAKKYGIRGLGVTLSEEQYKHANAAAKHAGVDKLVRFELTNYLDLPKRNIMFDRIVSVGMFEAVGRRNLHSYYKLIAKMLKPGGVSVLHTITQEKELAVDPWIDKYIFPGGYIPSVREVEWAFPDYGFRLIDYENLRLHYAMTLQHWLKGVEAHKKQIIAMYDERFYRMWKLYLLSSYASFKYWDMSLSQFVFTKGLNNDLPLTREFLYK